MGGIYFRITAGRAGASGANMRYITREPATQGQDKAIIAQNYPYYALEGDSYREQRQNISLYAEQKEEDELNRTRKGTGNPTTHYRIVVSFEDKVETQKAHSMGKEYLEKQFPNTRAIGAIHQDTNHTHIHFHIQSRDTNNKLLRFSPGQWKQTDREWNKIYSREFGKEKELEYLNKKMETREWKQSLIRGEGKEKPQRINTINKDIYKERDRRNAGVYELNKERDGRDKRSFADGSKEIENTSRAIQERMPEFEPGKQAANQLFDKSQRADEQFDKTKSAIREFNEREKQANQQVSRTESELKTTVREIESLREDLKGLGKELSKNIDIDKDMGRDR